MRPIALPGTAQPERPEAESLPEDTKCDPRDSIAKGLQSGGLDGERLQSLETCSESCPKEITELDSTEPSTSCLVARTSTGFSSQLQEDAVASKIAAWLTTEAYNRM